MSRRPARSPHGLGAAGRKLFREVSQDLHPSLELDAVEIQLLERAAVIADLVEILRRDLAERGPLVEGSTGRLMQNPAIDKIPRLQIQISRLLAQIKLEPEEPKTGQIGARARNRIRRNELLARGHHVA